MVAAAAALTGTTCAPTQKMLGFRRHRSLKWDGHAASIGIRFRAFFVAISSLPQDTPTHATRNFVDVINLHLRRSLEVI